MRHFPCPGERAGKTEKIKQRHRINLLKRFGLFAKPDPSFVQFRATSSKDLEEAYRLVHHSYLSSGYIKPQHNKLRMRVFELCPETATFVSKTPSHAIAGVVSVIQDSKDLGLPSDAVFHDEINAARGDNGWLCEFSNLVVIPDLRNSGTVTELMRCALAHAVQAGCTDIICSVGPRVARFYQMIGFKTVSEVKSFSDQVYDPVVLMRLSDIQNHFRRWQSSANEVHALCGRFFHSENPYFAKIEPWNRLNERMFSEQFEIAVLFSKCHSILLNSPQEVLSSLKRRLGDIFDLSQTAAKLDRSAVAAISREGLQSNACFYRRRPLRILNVSRKPRSSPMRYDHPLSYGPSPHGNPSRRPRKYQTIRLNRVLPTPPERSSGGALTRAAHQMASDSLLPAIPDADLLSTGTSESPS